MYYIVWAKFEQETEAHGGPGSCNPFSSGTCSAKHEGATRAHPENWKIKAKTFLRFALTDRCYAPLCTTFGSSPAYKRTPFLKSWIRPWIGKGGRDGEMEEMWVWGREGEGRLEGGRESCENGGVNEGINSGLAMTCVECFQFGVGGGGGSLTSVLTTCHSRSSLLHAHTSIPNMVVQCIHPRVYGCQATFKGNWGVLIKTQFTISFHYHASQHTSQL